LCIKLVIKIDYLPIRMQPNIKTKKLIVSFPNFAHALKTDHGGVDQHLRKIRVQSSEIKGQCVISSPIITVDRMNVSCPNICVTSKTLSQLIFKTQSRPLFFWAPKECLINCLFLLHRTNDIVFLFSCPSLLASRALVSFKARGKHVA